MGIRSEIATFLLNGARSVGNGLGCELVVETSDHSLHTSMEVPNSSTRAWDSNLWTKGQLFIRGYANPIKPYVERHLDQGEQDQARIKSSELEDDEDHTGIVASTMYRMYQDQHLASELMLPSEKWKRIFWAVIALGGLITLSVGLNLATMVSSGGF